MTNPDIGFELETTRRDLIALRVKYGAESPIGQQPEPPLDLIQRQMAELQALLAAQ